MLNPPADPPPPAHRRPSAAHAARQPARSMGAAHPPSMGGAAQSRPGRTARLRRAASAELRPGPHSRHSKQLKAMKSPAPPGLSDSRVWDRRESLSPETFPRYKSNCSERALSRRYSVSPGASPSVSPNRQTGPEVKTSGPLPPIRGVGALRSRTTCPADTSGSRHFPPRTAEREIGEPGSPPATPAGTPERGGGANAAAHRLSRPSVPPAGTQRKAVRTSDRRERNEVRSL